MELVIRWYEDVHVAYLTVRQRDHTKPLETHVLDSAESIFGDYEIDPDGTGTLVGIEFLHAEGISINHGQALGTPH